MALLKDFQSAARKHGAPATVVIIVLSIIGFLIAFVAPDVPVVFNAAFLPPLWPEHPWSILTYPYVADPMENAAFIIVLISCLWMYGMGGGVERDLGTKRFVIFWLVMTIIPAIIMWAAMAIFNRYDALLFMYLPLSAITIAWATRNPNAQVLFMFVIPVLGKWIGWITVGIVMFDYGRGYPPLGVFACLHLLLAYLYASNRIPGLAYGKEVFTRKREGWKPIERDDAYFADVKKREIERAERERLRKMFEGSLTDDPEDKR